LRHIGITRRNKHKISLEHWPGWNNEGQAWHAVVTGLVVGTWFVVSAGFIMMAFSHTSLMGIQFF